MSRYDDQVETLHGQCFICGEYHHGEGLACPVCQEERREFGGINTAPDDPAHVTQVLCHIAHLEEEQVSAIRRGLIQWQTDHWKSEIRWRLRKVFRIR